MGDIDKIVAATQETAKSTQAMLQAVQTLVQALGSLPASTLVPSGGMAAQQQSSGGTLDLTPLLAAIQGLKAPIVQLNTITLQEVAKDTGLLASPYKTPDNGTVNITVRIASSATGASLQFSHGGSTFGTLNENNGGALSPGGEYTFSVYVAQGESIQLSVSAQTTLDVLDVFFVPLQVAGGA